MATPSHADFHYDGNADEFVVRLHDNGKGYTPVAACNGKLEARVVVECINLVLDLKEPDCSARRLIEKLAR